MRLTILGALVFVCFSLLLARFIWLQVIKHEDYATKAEDNRIAVVPIVPTRGLILDRNGVVLARNYSAYTLEITPSKLSASLDSVIDELSTLVQIDIKDRRRFKKLLEESKNFVSVPLRTRLTDEEVARFTAQRFRFPGVEVQARLFRQYPMGEIASHVVGFIGRINRNEAKALDEGEDAANYNGTDHIGKEGLEKSYEKQLHGTTGYEEVEVSAGGRAMRTLSRTAATPGNNLILSIDIELQKWSRKRSANGAARPWPSTRPRATSSPTFPSQATTLTCSSTASTSKAGTNSILRWTGRWSTGPCPALTRPARPSSPSWRWPRSNWASARRASRFPIPVSSSSAATPSATTRWAAMARWTCTSPSSSRATPITISWARHGHRRIHDFMKPFGFGQLTGIDLNNEKTGVLPSMEWKRNRFKTPQQKNGWVATRFR